MNVLENAESILVKNLGFSNRAYGVLSRNNVVTASELLRLTEEEILSFKNAGKKTVDEIINKQKEIKSGNCEVTGVLNTYVDPSEDFAKWITTIEGINKCREYLQAHDIRISNMGLSVRAYNVLSATGITFLSEIVGRTLSEIRDLNNLGKLTAEEVYYAWVDYVTKVKSEILPEIFTEKVQWLVKDLANREDYRDKILEYVYYNNEPIENLNLSARSYNCLVSAGVRTLHDLMKLSPIDLGNLKNMGATSLNEIKRTIETYYDKNNEQIMSFCDPEYKITFDDNYIRDKIISLYKRHPFTGFNLDDFIKYFNYEIAKERISHVIGLLISKNQLEYVDFLCYRKHISVNDFLNEQIQLDNNKNYVILSKRLAGLTLEEIGTEYGLTRERIRQICDKTITKLKGLFVQTTGEEYFDEDYFMYLFSEYAIEKAVWNKTLSTPVCVYNYLDLVYGKIKGKDKKNLSLLIDDSNVSENIKLRFRLQEESEKIVIGGKIVGKTRTEVEDFVISQICTDDVRFDDFVVEYNKYLERHFVPYDESIYYTDSVLRTRENKISASDTVLWKYGKTFRYYDIKSRNYDELLAAINLEKYHNIRISTQKILDENPELMEQYDIRDSYELHNLLNKIVDKKKYDNIDFRRMPNIQFGSFDLYNVYEEIIVCLTPISENEFTDYVYQEYGFEPATVLASPEMVQLRSLYYKDGIYAAENKLMSDDNKKLLGEALSKEAYTLDDVKKIYAQIAPGADIDEVNKYNLASMDYYVRSGYVLKGYTNLNAYIRYILLKDVQFDISPYKKMFNSTQAFYIILQDLKRNFEILEFKPNQYVNISYLLDRGLKKEDIKEYCDKVVSLFSENDHFTLKTVKKVGINTLLAQLNLDDYFYERILAVDDRLSANTLCGTHMFYVSKDRVSAVSFTSYIMSGIESIDFNDLLEVFYNEYGIKFDDKWDLLYKLYDSEFYYDSMTGKLFLNKDCYYKEINME